MSLVTVSERVDTTEYVALRPRRGSRRLSWSTTLSLDISKNKVDVYDGKNFTSILIEDKEKILDLCPKTAYLETTGMYHRPITKFLLEHGVEVYEVNAWKLKKYREQHSTDVKTDKKDCLLIWKYVEQYPVQKRILRIGNQWEPLLRRYRMVSEMIGYLRTYRESCMIAQEHTNLQFIKELVRKFEVEHRSIERELRKITPEPLVERYGVIMTSLLLSFDPSRFPNGKTWASYLGFKLRTYQSGTISKKQSITKRGSSWARRLLYLRAMSFLKAKKEPYLSFHKGLKERGKVGKIPMAALMRKIATHFYYDFKSGRLSSSNEFID